MKRWLVLACTFGLLTAFAGCGAQSNEGLLDQDISEIGKAKSKMLEVKAKVDEAVDKANKDNNRPLKTADFEEAVNVAKQLKKISEGMQKVKERTDALVNKVSPEERQELMRRIQDRFTAASASLVQSQQALDESLKKAKDRAQQHALDDLTKTLKAAEGEFEVLARQG